MSVFVVDSSTIISLSINCLLNIFDKFKERGHRFIIPVWVYDEVVKNSIRIQRFAFEGYRIKKRVEEGIFEVYHGKISQQAREFLSYINRSFYAKNNPIRIIHPADAEAMILAKRIGDALIVDERNMRMVTENPEGMQKLLERKLHRHIRVDKKNLKEALSFIEDLPVLRSVDLVCVAWKDGLIPYDSKDVLKSILLSLKFSGCAISFDEINQYLNSI